MFASDPPDVLGSQETNRLSRNKVAIFTKVFERSPGKLLPEDRSNSSDDRRSSTRQQLVWTEKVEGLRVTRFTEVDHGYAVDSDVGNITEAL